jgi:hypothetical protein
MLWKTLIGASRPPPATVQLTFTFKGLAVHPALAE